MEASQSLLLDEESLAKVAEAKRPIFILEWLRFLEKCLVTVEKVGIFFILFGNQRMNFSPVENQRKSKEIGGTIASSSIQLSRTTCTKTDSQELGHFVQCRGHFLAI